MSLLTDNPVEMLSLVSLSSHLINHKYYKVINSVVDDQTKHFYFNIIV